MDQTNAIIDCDVARLNVPLRPFFARVGHNFVAVMRRVPADVTGLYVRIFKAGGAYYDISGVEHRDGTWSARIKGVCFPAAGVFKYEVHALACDDSPVALGEGVLHIADFSTTNTAVEPGTQQLITEIPCQGGGTVQTVMVWDGFTWVLQAIHNEEKL